MGIRLLNHFFAHTNFSGLICIIRPGESALTRMPASDNSAASDLANERIAAVVNLNLETC
ncbi:hypothetical protein NZF63_003597 [Salmonella enterica]